MRKSFAPRSLLVHPATLALLAGAFSILFGCASEEGVAPTCAQDVNASGHQTVDNGCNPFAVCKLDDNGDGFLDDQDATREPTVCCQPFNTSGDGKDYLYQLCMYGYGAGQLPSNSSSSSGGS